MVSDRVLAGLGAGRDRLAGMATKNLPAPIGATVEGVIRLIRGHRVILDADIAALYGVQTKVLLQAVKRNASRFPSDFAFQLTWEETRDLRSQSVTLDDRLTKGAGRGKYTKHLAHAFTEQGVSMLSSVLRSEQAIQVNIETVADTPPVAAHGAVSRPPMA